jgi:VWFA-related protein
LAAALELNKRGRDRRKIIFIISDGREYGSRASYKDVLKILLSSEITVYAMGVESSAIPIYRKLERVRLPRFGYDDILPKYANATGGEVFTEFTRAAIENSYGRTLADSRNRYTLGYATRVTPSSTYREIDVRVDLPSVKVAAKTGYYPLPRAR